MEINCQALLGEEMRYAKECCIHIEEGEIKEIHTGFKKGALDHKRYLAVPGLINAHTHIGDSFAKEACLGMRLHEAVGRNGKKWSLYKDADQNTVAAAMRETALDMLGSGITSFIDFREGGKEGLEHLKNATRDLPIDVVALGRDLDACGFESSDGLGLNMHQLAQIPRERKNKTIGIHAGEEIGEIRTALEHGPDFIVHFTNPEAGDVEKAKEQDCSVVLCPRSNVALGAGFPPVKELMEAGINLSLGTDNVMLNSPDMWREMEFLCKYGSLNSPIRPIEALKMATINPAKMLGKNSGTLTNGKTADMIFIDIEAPNLRHNMDLIATIATRCRPDNVRKTMIKGCFALDKDGRDI